MTAKEKLINALEGQGILVKVSTTKEAYEVFKNVSEFLNFRLVDKPESSDIIHSYTIHAYLVFSTRMDEGNSKLELDYAVMHGPIPANDLRILTVYQNTDELYELVSPPNIDKGIMIGDTSVKFIAVESIEKVWEMLHYIEDSLNFSIANYPNTEKALKLNIDFDDIVYIELHNNNHGTLDYTLHSQIDDDTRKKHSVYTEMDIERLNSHTDADMAMLNPAYNNMSISKLRDITVNYGIEFTTTRDGWLVIDGINNAVLTDQELVRYIDALETIPDIMKKFVRQ